MAFSEQFVTVRRRAVGDPERTAAAQSTVDDADCTDAVWRHSGAGWRSFLAEQARAVAALPETLDLPVCVLRLGPLVLAGIGGEIFAEDGLRLRGADPGRVVLPVSTVNAYHGYLAPRRAHVLGGYETPGAPSRRARGGARDRDGRSPGPGRLTQLLEFASSGKKDMLNTCGRQGHTRL